jgi:hypothetical protein
MVKDTAPPVGLEVLAPKIVMSVMDLVLQPKVKALALSTLLTLKVGKPDSEVTFMRMLLLLQPFTLFIQFKVLVPTTGL